MDFRPEESQKLALIGLRAKDSEQRMNEGGAGIVGSNEYSLPPQNTQRRRLSFTNEKENMNNANGGGMDNNPNNDSRFDFDRMNNLLDDNRMAVTRIDLKGAFDESGMQFPLAGIAQGESVR